MLTNYVIQYHAGLPAVDFTPFIEGQDSCAIEHRTYIEGAQGKDPLNANISPLHYYELIWKLALSFVETPLKDWNGTTKAWYVDEFFHKLGFSYEQRNGRLVTCYNGKVLS